MTENSYTTATQQVNNSLKTVTQAIEASPIREISSAVNKEIQPIVNVAEQLAETKEYADEHMMDIHSLTNRDMLSLDKGMVDKELQPKQPLKVNVNIEHD